VPHCRTEVRRYIKKMPARAILRDFETIRAINRKLKTKG